jgi:DNA-binding XRE family transcriptional regulator
MSAKLSESKKGGRDPDFVSAEAAILRAVRKVRERAAQARRPIVVFRNGKIVEEIPKKNAAGRYLLPFEMDEERSCTVAEVFPEYVGKEQEVALRAYRHREGLTQKRLAELTGIQQHHISEMENGKRTIGKERARRLAEALHCDYRRLL